MAVEFVGMIGARAGSETGGPNMSIIGGAVDRDYLKAFAQAHEDAGFDRVLVGYGSTGADGFAIMGYAAAHTERLGFLLAHRPGFVQPTLAARKLATHDQLTGGRLAVHIITGGSDEDLQRDGDWLDKDDRYRRTDEYLDIVRKVWTSERPFDFEGTYYRIKGAYSDVKPVEGSLPIYFGGASDIALEVGARRADTWATWGEPIASIRNEIDRVQTLAAQYDRKPNVSVSFRPILASTEEKAWERAYDILEKVQVGRKGLPPRVPQNAGSQRLLQFAEEGDVLDKRLFTAIAKATGAQGNSTALVGTPDQVAESLLDYVAAGVTTLLIRGFDPLEDAIDYGRDLIPMVRAEAAKRERDAARELQPAN
ncbi:alkanesulfonate monooxygenase [bacterium SCGC AG-212-C10]|nr:alkanesulfonate monooxygenase [bacterium SCGC AG-212-C10]